MDQAEEAGFMALFLDKLHNIKMLLEKKFVYISEWQWKLQNGNINVCGCGILKKNKSREDPV